MARPSQKIYRKTIQINGIQKEQRFTNKAAAETFQNMANRLIQAQESGVVDVEASKWARSLIEGAVKNYPLYDKMAKWGLVPPRGATKTIGDICQFFRNKAGVKKTTLQTYKKLENSLFDFWGENYPLQKITIEDAAAFVKYLDTAPSLRNGRKADPSPEASKRRREPLKEKKITLLSEATKAKRIQLARQFFRQAVRLRWIDENPFEFEHGASRPNIERMMYISEEDCLRVIRETANKRHRALICLWRFCGLRGAGEFALLDWSPRCIRWSTEAAPGSITVRSPKTEKFVGHEQRIIPMVPIVEECLRDLFDEAQEGQTLMFPGMSPASNPGKVCKDCFDRCGIKIFKAYNLRESFCCDLMEKGIEPMAYQELAGHSLKVGLQHYQIMHPERRRRADEKFMQIWGTGNLTVPPPENPENAPTGNLTVRAGSNPYKTVQSLENTGSIHTNTNKKEQSRIQTNTAQMWEAGLERTPANRINISTYENECFSNTGNLTVLTPEMLNADEITGLFLQVFEQMESGEKLAFIKKLMGKV